MHTSRGYFILTLYEKRVAADDLPFFLGLMEHLAARGITCPQPVQNRSGEALGKLARPARRRRHLSRRHVDAPADREPLRGGRRGAGAAAPCRRGLSDASAPTRFRSQAGGLCSSSARERADSVQRDLRASIARELDHLRRRWPRDLPQGVIHADLFPDNVFFLGDKLSGLIDFYFACTDTLAYDVAICLNAWCFEPDHSFNVTKGRALLQAYTQGAAAVGARSATRCRCWRAARRCAFC